MILMIQKVSVTSGTLLSQFGVEDVGSVFMVDSDVKRTVKVFRRIEQQQ